MMLDDPEAPKWEIGAPKREPGAKKGEPGAQKLKAQFSSVWVYLLLSCVFFLKKRIELKKGKEMNTKREISILYEDLYKELHSHTTSTEAKSMDNDAKPIKKTSEIRNK